MSDVVVVFKVIQVIVSIFALNIYVASWMVGPTDIRLPVEGIAATSAVRAAHAIEM